LGINQRFPKEKFENGKDYYAHHGKQLAVMPESAMDRPAPEFLSWHNGNVFEKSDLRSQAFRPRNCV
jgi:hypothetical protein